MTNNEILVAEYNPNPICKDPHYSGDCMIRAICMVTGHEWVDVYNRLCKRGLEMGSMPNGIHVVAKEFEDELQLIDYKNANQSAREFILTHQIGSYIINIKRHAFALVNGIAYDAEADTLMKDVGNRKVFSYFITKPKE